MNLRQLEAFNTVMMTGSASQAAEILHISQPGISSLIIKLEKHLGVALFERTKGRLIPTPEALYLVHEVKTVFDNISNITHAMKNVQTLSHWSLSIACLPGPSGYIVPNIISRYIEDKQGTKVSIQTLYSHEVREWVESHKHDIGLAERSQGFNNLSVDPIDLDCVCALPISHPLTRLSQITVKDLDNVPMITLQPNNMTNQALRRLFSESSVRMDVRCETHVFMSALSMVECGMGVAIVDPAAAYTYAMQREQNSKIVFRPFFPKITFKMGVMYPKHNSVSVLTKQFGAMLKSEIMNMNDISVYQPSKIY